MNLTRKCFDLNEESCVLLGKLLIQLVINKSKHIKALCPLPRRTTATREQKIHTGFFWQWCVDSVSTWETVALCVRFQVLTHLPEPPCPLSKLLSSWTAGSPCCFQRLQIINGHTMTPMEDYKDSLSLCQSAYCIDFVILVIDWFFFAVEQFYYFLSLLLPFFKVLYGISLENIVKC